MTLRLRLGLTLTAFLVPLAVLAAPPNVTNIRSMNENGRVRVTWNQVSGTIASYRIYYSHQSILENAGSYDDFETADGSTNTYLLQTTPASSELYVSVLAVDSTGMESPFFVEEARLTLQAGSTSSAASSAISSAAQSVSSAPSVVIPTNVSLLAVQSLSSTGVVLTFSSRVVIPTDRAAEAISIKDASGSVLALTKLIIEGQTVTVHTTPQERGRAYLVRIGDVVTGVAPNGAILSLAADQQPLLFLGHQTGTAPVVVPGNNQQPDVTADVQNLRITMEPTKPTYTVEAMWQAPAGGGVTGYEIAQSTDGGRTFGAPRMIGSDVTNIRIPGIPPSSFGLRVRAVYGAGVYSDGVVQTVRLPAFAPTQVTGNIGQDGKGSTALPNSGPALWLAIISLLSAAGTWAIRSHGRKLA